MKPILLAAIFAWSVSQVPAQDKFFVPPMAAPLNYNAAFAGTAGVARLSGVYHQLRSRPFTEKILKLNYDQPCASLKGGLGLDVSKVEYHGGAFTFNSVASAYNRHFIISPHISLRAGVQLSVIQEAIDYDEVIFYQGPQTGRLSQICSDVATGVLFYGNSWYAGLSVAHLNTPQIPLPDLGYMFSRQCILQGGYWWQVTKGDKGWAVHPNLMVLTTEEPEFRGAVSVHKNWLATEVSGGMDFLNLLVGVNTGNLKVSYGYQIATSRLFFSSPHEVALVLFIKNSKKDIPSLGANMFQRAF